MTTDLALLGLCTGLGVVLVVAGMASRRTSLAAQMGRYDPNAVLARYAGTREEVAAAGALTVIGGSLDRLVASLTTAS